MRLKTENYFGVQFTELNCTIFASFGWLEIFLLWFSNYWWQEALSLNFIILYTLLSCFHYLVHISCFYYLVFILLVLNIIFWMEGHFRSTPFFFCYLRIHLLQHASEQWAWVCRLVSNTLGGSKNNGAPRHMGNHVNAWWHAIDTKLR